MEKEFDELDAGFDSQLANMLSPELVMLTENLKDKPEVTGEAADAAQERADMK